MANQPIAIGLADGKAGDNLFTGATKINSNFAENYASISTIEADVLANAAAILANTALITGFTKTYWFDANDTATTTTPISHAGGAAGTYLTNDALGGSTNQYNPDSNDTPWNPVTNKFDFTSLKTGDTIELRGDIEIDSLSANQELEISMSLGEGQPTPYELPVSRFYFKSIAAGYRETFMFRIYMGDEVTRLGGARFRIASPDNASIKVNGWFYQITEV